MQEPSTPTVIKPVGRLHLCRIEAPMRRSILVIISVLLMAPLLAFEASSRPPIEAESPQAAAGESVQALKLRIQQLEKQISAMQRRIDELQAKAPNRIPALPCPDNKMPPGSHPFYFNGMQFWYIPVTPGEK